MREISLVRLQKLGADTAIQRFKKAAQMGLELPGLRAERRSAS
jgi:hypothetical protein